jgi:hypothetical protein
MHPSIASIAVVFLVVTAGCGGFVGDDDETAIDDSPDDELLPGLTESAVTDRHVLLNEHYTALEEEGYRLDWDRTVSDASGAVLEFENGSTVVAANRTLARERFVGENESVELDRWSNDEETILRENRSGSVTYVPDASATVELTPPIPLDEAYDAVDSITVEGNSSERYVLEGTADALGNYESVSFRLVLDEEGYLTGYALEGTLRDEESSSGTERTTVEEAFTLEPTDADPDEPDWLEEARDEIDAETVG